MVRKGKAQRRRAHGTGTMAIAESQRKPLVLTKWPYVDGPDGKHYFCTLNDLVGCGHMSGLSMRSICPLALMESDDRDPYHVDELYAHIHWRVVPDLRWRPCRSSRLIALAKLEPANLPV